MLDAAYATAEAALSAEIAAADASAKTPLRIVGGGTRAGIGKPVKGAKTASTADLNGISLYEPGALTIVAGAGNAAWLRSRRRWRRRNSACRLSRWTIAGCSAPRAHRPSAAWSRATSLAPRRIQAGACRDAMLGVRFIDGRGDVIMNGGRVMKNVTGYDLVKLMTGSWGTLGVLTEVALKVQPMPEASATLALSGLDDAAAVVALSAALGSPYDINGAAHVGGRTLVPC